MGYYVDHKELEIEGIKVGGYASVSGNRNFEDLLADMHDCRSSLKKSGMDVAPIEENPALANIDAKQLNSLAKSALVELDAELGLKPTSLPDGKSGNYLS